MTAGPITAAPTHTVLVVDDTPENLDLMRAILAQDYKVRVAINGEAALKLAGQKPPDLVLLDVMMPGMDGYEVCRRLKADPATAAVPVIFVTALSEAADDARALDAGGADIVVKPVSAPTVLARVRTHLALCRLEDATRQAAAALEAGEPPAGVAAGLRAAVENGR